VADLLVWTGVPRYLNEKFPQKYDTNFFTHLLESGSDIRTIQELLGHREVKTTMIYTHVLNQGPGGFRSPLDGMRTHQGRVLC